MEKAIKKGKRLGNNLEFFAINREKLSGFESWHFQFAIAFDLRGHRSSQIDVKGIKSKIILQ